MNSKRLPNFSIDEIKILVAAVNEKRKIIDSKKLDKYSVCLKAEAWKEIETAYNDCSSIYRPVALLKKKYENLKRELRRKPTEGYKNQLSETGDGPPAKKNLCGNYDKVSAKLNEKSNEVQHSIYFNDYIDESNGDTQNPATWLEDNKKTKNFIKQEPEVNAQFLDTNEESVEWTEGKDKAVLELLKEQHEFKVKFMKEEHAFKMKCMLEKHSIEIKILEQQLKNAQNKNKI